MSTDLERRLREAFHDDAARARLVHPDRPAEPAARPPACRRAPSRRAWVAVAAAIPLLVAAGALLLDQADPDDTDVTLVPAGTSTTTPAPIATMPSTATDLDPGTYRVPASPGAVSDFTLAFPDGWHAQFGHNFSKHEGTDQEITLRATVVDEIFSDPCLDGATPVPVGPSASDLVDALLAQPGTEAGPPVPVTIGDQVATRLDLRVPATTDLETCRLADAGVLGLQLWYSEPADDYFVLLPDAVASVYVVDVDGRRPQVFVTQHRTGTPEADIAELQGILDSIRMGP